MSGETTISIELTAEAQAELERQAAAHDRAVEISAASLLEDAVRLPGSARKLRQDQLENTLREMAQFSKRIPEMVDETFTRESFYRDPD